MRVLITGGAGYIGSFMVKRLLDDGNQVTVFDSLERGDKSSIDTRAEFVEGNLLDNQALEKAFSQKPNSVIHFAGYISMGESMQNPSIYFTNNTFGTLSLLEKMHKYNVSRIVFSSTAGVYGNPEQIPIPENHSKLPTNPYGESKLMVERMLEWYSKIFNIHSVSLRYFNAAGAALDGSMGENHEPETHIIPNAIRAVLSKTPFTLYGNDYKTLDGTCIRDYIHVLDLVEAHVLAIKKLQLAEGAFVYNVGTGKGYSNKQVLEMIKEISQQEMSIVLASKRAGDAQELVADSSKISSELGFSPQFSNLRTIVESAWKWHVKKSEVNFRSSQ